MSRRVRGPQPNYSSCRLYAPPTRDLRRNCLFFVEFLVIFTDVAEKSILVRSLTLKIIFPTSRMSRIGVFGQISEITDHLFLSGAGCLKPEKIRQKRIVFIVNATTEEPNTYIQG
ncbi:hypothetical protein ANCDUO_18931 [Ancylostoma duodenale]|uniref:Uncharacterized protein n=1 Tax=Ancylostoma duodenale TaxID=51022 RepID=A0A0C2G1R3_9BILA|nr:hypothetical protein ANCDUO_18931 [Ancylostoma duodenale]